MSLIASIDCNKFINNINAVKAKTRTNIIAVVKADAYGHGAQKLAPLAQPHVASFAVIDRREARQLVQAGIYKPIHILSPCEWVEDNFWTENMIPTICCIRDIRELSKLKPKSKFVNLEINTGMNRLGVAPGEIGAAFTMLLNAGFKLYSVFSHLYNCFDLKASSKQLQIFNSAVANLPKNIKRHIAASSSANLPQEFYLDAVRPGIGLYGYGADEIVSPIMHVAAPIIKIFAVKKGEHISYGNVVAKHDMLIAAIRAGYADGIRRKDNPECLDRLVSVAGKKCPIVGQVCMDITMVDITAVMDKVNYNTPVVILGDDICANDIAEQLNTNCYEVLTAFKGRIVRKYIE